MQRLQGLPRLLVQALAGDWGFPEVGLDELGVFTRAIYLEVTQSTILR
jgi:hypothetical protein